jgi:hypothetical protein
MGSRFLGLVTAALLAAPSLASAQDAPPAAPLSVPAPLPVASAPAPSSGPAYLLPGGILAGLGAINRGTAPLCTLSVIRSSAQPACLAASLAFGGAFLAVGIPLLVVGARRRGAVPAVGVAPVVGGALVTWSTKF